MKQTLTTLLLLCALFAQGVNPQDKKQNVQVYTTETGKKYHTHKDCQYIRNSVTIKTTNETQAKKDGKSICARCNSKDKKTTNK